MLRFSPASKPLAAVENRVRDAVAGRDAEFAGGSADDFQHRAHRAAGWDEPRRQRLGVLGDPQDAAVARG